MMPWIPGVGWDAPLEPPHMRNAILAFAIRWTPLDWWEARNKVSIDHSKPEQKIERPRFGRKGV